jgi:hypothetical protein
MKHLSQEDIVLSYYDEPEHPAHREHLATCALCQEELTRLRAVLDRVTPLEVPEPDEDYEKRVWDRLHWRMRREPRRPRFDAVKWLAAAAVFAMAFVSGLLWNRGQKATQPAQIATATAGTKAAPAAAQNTAPGRDRILLVVVSNHFDQSERMLVELTNLTPQESTDITSEKHRAEELLTSNRLYRQTALDRGEEDVSTLLDELEPVLMQIAHAPSQMSAEEIRRIQKRVETKGLVFKLRVVRADVRNTSRTTNYQPNV